MRLIGLLMCVGWLSHATCSAQSPPLPKAIKTGKETTYSITMETILEVPNNKNRVEQIRVYHALPTQTPWSKSAEKYGATKVEFDKKLGKIESHAPSQSHHVLFTASPVQKPGTKLTFTTTMQIVSVERQLDFTATKMQWGDFNGTFKDRTAVVNQRAKNNAPTELMQLAKELKAKYSPLEAVNAMAAWVKGTIRYDASVNYATTNVTEIVRQKKGHCGHQATVFEYLTALVGVPMRTVWGMNLYAPDGRTSDLQRVRADFTNIHTWAEVYFPNIGWVEVDPNLGDKAFVIPPYLIQNNRWFQNYAIWLRENGRERQPSWLPVQGGFRSDFGVEHIISYQKK